MSTFEVSLIPSQHRFQASPQQSLLEAGLQAGLNLRYGCEGGNCGECMARLVQGEIRPIRHSDYVLPPTLRKNQFFLTCCYAATTDCQLEVAEIGSVKELARQSIEARVYKISELSQKVISVALKTPRSQPLNFFAGQSILLCTEHGLKRHKSIASCPCDGLKPEIHVKYRQGDEFSEYMFHHVQKNERLTLEGPNGEFVLDDDTERDVLFIAYDTGFASIKSLLEHAIALEKEQAIQLYWIVTPNNMPYLENYCRSIEDALDNVSYMPIAIKQASEKCIREVLKKIISQEKTIKEADVYITLPQEFRHIAISQFSHAGLDDRHWHIDDLVKL